MPSEDTLDRLQMWALFHGRVEVVLYFLQAEMVRFINALEKHLSSEDKTLLSASDMFAIADEIDLQVENIRSLIDEMNEAGENWNLLQGCP
jgi:hypothetical protein